MGNEYWCCVDFHRHPCSWLVRQQVCSLCARFQVPHNIPGMADFMWTAIVQNTHRCGKVKFQGDPNRPSCLDLTSSGLPLLHHLAPCTCRISGTPPFITLTAGLLFYS